MFLFIFGYGKKLELCMFGQNINDLLSDVFYFFIFCNKSHLLLQNDSVVWQFWCVLIKKENLINFSVIEKKSKNYPSQMISVWHIFVDYIL